MENIFLTFLTVDLKHFQPNSIFTFLLTFLGKVFKEENFIIALWTKEMCGAVYSTKMLSVLVYKTQLSYIGKCSIFCELTANCYNITLCKSQSGVREIPSGFYIFRFVEKNSKWVLGSHTKHCLQYFKYINHMKMGPNILAYTSQES